VYSTLVVERVAKDWTRLDTTACSKQAAREAHKVRGRPYHHLPHTRPWYQIRCWWRVAFQIQTSGAESDGNSQACQALQHAEHSKRHASGYEVSFQPSDIFLPAPLACRGVLTGCGLCHWVAFGCKALDAPHWPFSLSLTYPAAVSFRRAFLLSTVVVLLWPHHLSPITNPV